MQKIGKIKTILVLAVALCFAVISVVMTGTTTSPGGKKEPKGKKVKTNPIWQIIQEGTCNSVVWLDHVPNPRFAIYDPEGNSDPNDPDTLSDDLVLDKETGLIWARDANLLEPMTWVNACWRPRSRVQLGNRSGWRLPTVEELSSLLDPSKGALPELALPDGHPFMNVGEDWPYWTSTTSEGAFGGGSAGAYHVWFGSPNIHSLVYLTNKANDSYRVWPVRGGTGYATGDW